MSLEIPRVFFFFCLPQKLKKTNIYDAGKKKKGSASLVIKFLELN